MVALDPIFARMETEHASDASKRMFIGHERSSLETPDPEDGPSLEDAIAAANSLLEGTGLKDPLYLLTVFTSHPDFEFGEPLPSQLVTLLISLLQDSQTDPEVLMLSLEFIGNLWRFYDPDLPLLIDPELIDCVWQHCLAFENTDYSSAAFSAFLCLAFSDLESTQEMFSESALSDLQVILESGSAPPPFILNSLRYLVLVAESDGGSVLSPFCPFLVHCLCDSHIEDIELCAVEILVSLVSRHSVFLPEDILNVIVGHMQESPDLGCYSILRGCRFFPPAAEFIELLVRDIAASACSQAVCFYHYLELFMTAFPGLAYEQGMVDALMTSADEMCAENKQCLGLLIASYLALPEMDAGLRTELLHSGMLELLCDIVQSVDVPAGLVIMKFVWQIVQNSEAGVSAAILERDFISAISEHGGDCANDDFCLAVAGLERFLVQQATLESELMD
jgi:hypothetical protein